MFEYMTQPLKSGKFRLGGYSGFAKENRIDGVININRVWLIPKDAKKPTDGRKKLTT